MTHSDALLEREFLAHWCRLSQVQRRALLALSHEIIIACDLVEESIEGLTGRFLGLADNAKKLAMELGQFNFVETETLRQNLSLLRTTVGTKNDASDALMVLEDVLLRNEENILHQHKMIGEAEMVAKGFEDVVTLLQFQDRTSQRLTVISDALQSVAALAVKMHDETLEKIVISQQDQAEDRWIEELVSDIQLGEIRERFIKHALFDKCSTLFAEIEAETDNSDRQDSTDDIELF